MDDLISREAALNCFHDWIDKRGDVHTSDEMAEYRAIEALPTVQPDEEALENAYNHGYTAAEAEFHKGQPERIKGRWQICGKDAKGHSDTFECSECGCLVSYAYYVPDCDYQFCPHCGADMRGEEDGSTD